MLMVDLGRKSICRVAAYLNNRINSDWQFRFAPLPAGYAGRSLKKYINNDK
jgi:hypothetical protein